MGVELLSSCAGFVQLTNRNLINRHMKNDSLEKLIWVLIYGGLLTLGVSFAVPEGSKALGAVFRPEPHSPCGDVDLERRGSGH